MVRHERRGDGSRTDGCNNACCYNCFIMLLRGSCHYCRGLYRFVDAALVHEACGNLICFPCFQMNNTIQPTGLQLDTPMIHAGPCPFCRGFTQWTDVDSGREVQQCYRFIHREGATTASTTLTAVHHVNEWNNLCEQYSMQNLWITHIRKCPHCGDRVTLKPSKKERVKAGCTETVASN